MRGLDPFLMFATLTVRKTPQCTSRLLGFESSQRLRELERHSSQRMLARGMKTKTK